MKITINGVVIDLEKVKDQSDLDTQVTAAVTKGVEGLSNKNSELLGEIKDLKTKLKDAVTADDQKALQTKLDAAQAELTELKKTGTGDYKALYEKSQQDHKAELEQRDSTIKTLERNLEETIVTNELTMALSEVNVNPVLSKSAAQILKGEITVVEQGGKKVGRVGDKDINTFVKEWASTDVGKNFVLSGNQGGGSGGNRPGQGGVDPRSYFDPKSPNYSVTKQSEVYNTDQALYESLSNEFTPEQQ